MFTYSYSLNQPKDTTQSKSQIKIHNQNTQLLEEAILSPNKYSSCFYHSPSSLNSCFSSKASYKFYSKLHERGQNIVSTEISNSRFPHTSPSNVIKTDGISYYYLPYNPFSKKKKTLVLELDNTIVHSSFTKPFLKPDYSMTFEYNNQYYPIYTCKRPYLDEFLCFMAQKYEIVIFTTSIPKYANMVIDAIDTKKCISHRLYREHCTQNNNKYIKELKRIGRDLKDVIILDSNSSSYELNKENALPIDPWLYDKTDKELLQIQKVFDLLAEEDDVRPVIKNIIDRHNKIDYNAVDMIRNSKVRKESLGNTLTYQMDNDNSPKDKKTFNKYSYSKIEYPKFKPNISIDNHTKLQTMKESMTNELGMKKKNENKTITNVMSMKKKCNNTIISKEIRCDTLEKINKLRNEIEHTKRYFKLNTVH